MGGSGQDAEVEPLVDVELLAEFASQHAPLVVAEIVEYYEEDFLPLVEQREYLGLENVGR